MNNELNYEYRWESQYNYPGSYVLKNYLNIRTKEELDKAKAEIVAIRYAQILHERITGIFDFYHLKCIHKLLFGDIFEWAGKPKIMNPSKENPFTSFDFIIKEITPLLLSLKEENYLTNIRSKEMLAKKLAYYYGGLYKIHPFREGNGLTIRVFIEHLSWRAGYELNLMDITKEEIDLASAKSINSEYDFLEKIILKSLTKRD